jgi:hypothetical protein
MEQIVSGHRAILAETCYPHVPTQEAVNHCVQAPEAADPQVETANPAEVWEVHSLLIGVIRFVGPCEYEREDCVRPAGIRIEVRNGRASSEWDGEYCHEHAARLVAKARTAGVTIIED